MRLSRLLVTSLFLGSALVACGGDDGGGGGTPDASTQIDAPMIDAPPTAQPAQGLGKRCDNMNPCPATGATQCTTLQDPMTATYGFCTLPCGTTMAGSMTPPMGGNAVCTGSMPQPPSGTPLCALTAQPMGGMMEWACAVTCGTIQGMDLGMCPAGLTCIDNVCT